MWGGGGGGEGGGLKVVLAPRPSFCCSSKLEITVNLLYIDTRYIDKIHYNNNLTDN